MCWVSTISRCADGARTGAPNAIQVADRWHLWHNLADAVEKTVQSHRSCLHDTDTDTASDNSASTPIPEPQSDENPKLGEPGAEQRLVTRVHERHAAVQQLRAEGLSLNAIGRNLGLCFRTVQRFAAATTPDELLARAVDRESSLDPFKPHLNQRHRAVDAPTRRHCTPNSTKWAGAAAYAPCNAICVVSPLWRIGKCHGRSC